MVVFRTRWRTAQDEYHFVLAASGVIAVAASVLSMIYVPNAITFIAFLYICKVIWNPNPPPPPADQDPPEFPLKTLIRAAINVIIVGNISLMALFFGSPFFRQFTLQDTYELYKGKPITSDKASSVLMNYYFGFWVSMLVWVNVFRFFENFFTGVAGLIQNLL